MAACATVPNTKARNKLIRPSSCLSCTGDWVQLIVCLTVAQRLVQGATSPSTLGRLGWTQSAGGENGCWLGMKSTLTWEEQSCERRGLMQPTFYGRIFQSFLRVCNCTLCNVPPEFPRSCKSVDAAHVLLTGEDVCRCLPGSGTWKCIGGSVGSVAETQNVWRAVAYLRSIKSAVSACREGRVARSKGCSSPREAILQKHTR